MAKKTAVNFSNYDFTANPDNYTYEEITTIRRMTAAGEPIYLAPIEVEHRENLETLHITYAECKTWHIGSEPVCVHLTPASAEIYDLLLGDLRAKHRDGVRRSRCMVIGKRGKPIRCDERNKCRECPFGRKPEDREYQEVSWNEMVEKGYDPAAHDSTSEPALNRFAYQEIRAEWDAEDQRLSRAFEMSEAGYDVKDIMTELKLSKRRIYQLIEKAKEMAKQSH